MIAEMFARGARAVRANLRLVAALYLVQLGVSLVFVFAVARTFTTLFGKSPLFARGIGGDEVALLLALIPNAPAMRALVWAGVGMALGYALVSFYLGAGLLGALAGQSFVQTANRRALGFFRLWLWSLLPYALAAVIGAIGVRVAEPRIGDLLAWDSLVGVPLAGALPGLLLVIATACAVDYARADLVLRGGGSARALLGGFRRVFTRPWAMGHYALYLLTWTAITALFIAATFGRDFPGAAGGWLLFLLRQTTAAARFVARVTASGGQIAALQIEVLEVRELVKGAEPGRDVADGQPAQPVE